MKFKIGDKVVISSMPLPKNLKRDDGLPFKPTDDHYFCSIYEKNRGQTVEIVGICGCGCGWAKIMIGGVDFRIPEELLSYASNPLDWPE
jgi:hypothetical protein